MRKLSAGNQKVILTFVLVIVVIIAILILFLKLALNLTKEEYVIDGSKIAYDEEYSQVEVKNSGTINKKWDGNYYLTVDDELKSYKLGGQGVVYDPTKLNIDLYGNVYRVYMDGQVEKLSGETKIDDLQEDKIYKLADRKYLITGSTLENDTGTILTQNYLLIVIDKSGNTLILNNELNAKTINPMIIRTPTFQFDIANEKLIYNNEQIDLKKIIGSTNEYVSPNIENTIEIANQTEQQTIQTENMGGQTYYNNEQQITQNNNSTTIIDNSNNGNKSYGAGNNNSDTNTTPISKSVSLRSITTGSTYMDINYIIIDPESKYQTVYILVEAVNENSKLIALDKTQTTYRVNNLKPNKDYKVTLAYKEIKADNTREEVVEDTMNVRTLKVETKLNITKISHRSGKNTVYFNLKMDSNYVFDSAKIILEVDGNVQNSKSVDISSSASSNGWTSSFEYESGTEIVLRLDNILYKGEEIDEDIVARVKL